MMHMRNSVLRKRLQFKRTAADEFKWLDVGERVRYSRDPLNAGRFVIWAGTRGLLWYHLVEAVELPDVVQVPH